MSVFHNNALIGAGGGAAAAAVDANITKSLRFTSGDSAFLNKTFSSAGNRKTFTFSCWVKRAKLGVRQFIFEAGSSDTATDRFMIRFQADDTLMVTVGQATNRQTSQLFRDVGSWGSLIVAVDTTASTADDRIKIYWNGSQITDFSSTSNPSQNANTGVNSAAAHSIGKTHIDNSHYLDACLADIYLIDGSALSPTSFGSFDSSGVWQAAGYSGTYGTNGAHLLDFANEATIGHDSSGNENDFTANNLTGTDAKLFVDKKPDGSNWGNISNAFDGNTSTYADGTYNNGTTSTITFNPPITGVTSLRVYWYGTSNYGYNGSNVGSGSTTAEYKSVYSGSAITVSSIQGTSQPGNGVVRLYAIEVNGSVLTGYSRGTPAEIDVLFDVPVNDTTNTDSGAGGEVSGNYCCWNPLFKAVGLSSNGTVTLTNGNLEAAAGGGSWTPVASTIAVTSGKWYAEFEVTSLGSSNHVHVGISPPYSYFSGVTYHSTSQSGHFYGTDGQIWSTGSPTTGYTTSAVGDIIGVALDFTASTVTFTKNGSSIGSVSLNSNITSNGAVFAADMYPTGSVTANWGQRPFAYSAPSNHKALCTTNLPTPAISDGGDYFDILTWTGDGPSSTRTITGLSMVGAPDWIWAKERNGGSSHALFDSVRGYGTNNVLKSHSTDAAGASNGGYINSVSTSSIEFAQGSSTAEFYDASGKTYVAWCWTAGANSNKTYTVTVVSDSGNKYRFDGGSSSAVTLDLAEGSTYIFDQSDSSNSGHPLRFSTTSDGTHNSGSEYTTGVTTTGTPGSAGAKTTIVVAASAPTLHYYCSAHSGMGGQVNTNSTEGSTRVTGEFNSTAYNQSQNWSSNFTSSNGFATSAANAFDGNITTEAYASSNGGVLTMTFSPSLTGEIVMDIPNGGTFKNSSTNAVIGTYSSGIWTYTASSLPGIKIEQTGGRPNPRQVKLDGKILVDSTATPPAIPSIQAVVKANTTAGFSIVKAPITSSGGTIPHGLSGTPELIVVKNIGTGGTNWVVWHPDTGSSGYLLWNTTGIKQSSVNIFNGNDENTFAVGSGFASSTPDFICHCFKSVPGFSKVGSYEANSSATGPFVFTDFRPKYLWVKNIDDTQYSSAYNWTIIDTSRYPHNETAGDLNALYINSAADENTYSYGGASTGLAFEIFSNGFRPMSASAEINTGNTYIFYAVAEVPFSSNGGLAR